MHILMTGGTGFIGRALCRALLPAKHRLTVYSRQSPERVAACCGAEVRAITSLSEEGATTYDAIINLAGEGITDARWTPARKQRLRDSRIEVTRQLITYIERAPHKPEVLLSASAIGFYGDRGEVEIDETTPPRDGFAHALCADWETTAQRAATYGVRVCLLRIGVVLGPDGGMLGRLVPIFRLGLGGRLGDGRQWLSWIHRDDLIAILLRLLEDRALDGVFNATAPQPVTNAMFTQQLAHILRRPALLPVPAQLLRGVYGEMADLLLGSQRVVPQRLQQSGFVFRYPTLDAALSACVTHQEA